jgi:tRNA 5-methylaminomethyl-2-thiouridine biosynthesis bifunctional protein
MTTAPITPAQIAFADDGTPCAPQFGDVYHAAGGALAQAEHVFLRGNGLPARWAQRRRFVILETGFGLGNNFLATWAAWRAHAHRCERLHYVAIEKHPLSRDDLARVHAASSLRALADQLVAQWPLPTPNLHPLAFDNGRVQLLLAFGDVAALLPQLQCEADALFLDGFAPAKNAAMWGDALWRRLPRLMAREATAATWSAARVVRDGLASAGFEVQSAPGFDAKRDMTVARFAPRHHPAVPAAFARRAAPAQALVVGAGLAGCAAAHALALQGVHCTVLDRHREPAQAASGNPAGLMHGTFNAPDGVHARWHRAAALAMQRAATPWLAQQSMPGALQGFLRLEPRLSVQAVQAMQVQLAAVGLPAGYVRWMDVEEARAASGLPVPSGGWWFGGGGWLAPQALCDAWLRSPDEAVQFAGGAHVAALRRESQGWCALDAHGRELARAPVVVLAGAADVAPLLGGLGITAPPLLRTRGQVTELPAGLPGVGAARVPVSGDGYVLTLADGRHLLGASSQPGDEDSQLRAADHVQHLAAAARLGLLDAAAHDRLHAQAATLAGRVGWRAVTPDRLPVIGPPVDADAWARLRARGQRADAPRHLPRHHDDTLGLYLLTGLGSRGLTTAWLSAQVLAAWITGAPCPVEADLRDATDAARFALRGGAG